MPRSEADQFGEQMRNLTVTLMNLNALAEANVDRELIPGLIDQIKAAEAGLRAARYQLESLQAGRVCPTCGGPVVGRSDRAYCSTACRVEQHRGTSPRMQEIRRRRKEARQKEHEEWVRRAADAHGPSDRPTA